MRVCSSLNLLPNRNSTQYLEKKSPPLILYNIDSSIEGKKHFAKQIGYIIEQSNEDKLKLFVIIIDHFWNYSKINAFHSSRKYSLLLAS
jgi:hypothetical protein